MKFDFKTVIDLGFSEQFIADEVYFNRHGFRYSIINLNLTVKIYLQWNKETKNIQLHRTDSTGNILKTINIVNKELLEEIIEFFNGEIEETINIA